jgi:hypothetical protein
MLCADRGHRAGAHVGQAGRVDDRDGPAGRRIEEVEQPHLGGQPGAPVVDEIADDLDAGVAERGDVAAQHVEMAVEARIRLEVHARAR